MTPDGELTPVLGGSELRWVIGHPKANAIKDRIRRVLPAGGRRWVEEPLDRHTRTRGRSPSRQ